MKLIVFSGLPATGKSKIANAVGRKTGTPVFNKDWIEATILRAGLGVSPDQHERVAFAGYQLLTTLAARQLLLGQSAILDSVVGLERTRTEWRNLAAAHKATWCVVECICSDENLHRARLASREAVPGRRMVSWAHVQRVKNYFEPWHDDRLVLDSARPLDYNVRSALEYLAHKPG